MRNSWEFCILRKPEVPLRAENQRHPLPWQSPGRLLSRNYWNSTALVEAVWAQTNEAKKWSRELSKEWKEEIQGLEVRAWPTLASRYSRWRTSQDKKLARVHQRALAQWGGQKRAWNPKRENHQPKEVLVQLWKAQKSWLNLARIRKYDKFYSIHSIIESFNIWHFLNRFHSWQH